VHLDKNRELIIDSKVSLSSFIDYVNAENAEERQRFLKAHIDSIWRHVKELSDKDYSSYIQPPKVRMDYVIMFVPHTGALWTALNAQPDLWRKAMEKNVFIADEQTLFAALRIINLTWTQIVQAENHEKVYRLAEEMLDRVGKFVKSYDDMGRQIERLQKAYEEGGRKLAPNGQSIITTSMKLIKLGARQNPKNPVADSEDIETAGSLPAMEQNENEE
jgi:DNA recombination protein RmuC